MTPIVSQPPTTITSITDIRTRQPMELTKPKRGGKRDPLPRFTLTIPNYVKYQKTAKRRDWVSLWKGIGRDSRMVQACERGLSPLAVFCVLLTLADDAGVIADVRAKDLSLEICGVDQRTIMGSIEILSSIGVITMRQANAEQTVSKHSASTEQALSKQSASTEQTVSVQSLHEESRNDAGLTPPIRQDKDITRQDKDKNKAKNKRPIRRHHGSAFFEAWWEASAKTGSKADCLEVWEEMGLDAQADAVMAGTAAYLASSFVASGRQYGMPRFLADRLFESRWEPVKAKAKAETYVDAAGVERYPSGIQKYDLTPYTAGW